MSNGLRSGEYQITTMASNSATSPKGSGPLGSMTRLSPCVYIYRPPTPSQATSHPETDSTTQKPTPKLIVLAAWMGARDAHIAKYLAPYQALFPTAPILLLRSEPWHFLRPGGIARELAPAVAFVRSIFPELSLGDAPAATTKRLQTTNGQKRQPQLLLQAWSNGGTTCLHYLRLALLQSTTTSSTATVTPSLPPYTLVLDSTPGTFTYRTSYRAFTAGLERPLKWLIAPLMHMLCAWFAFLYSLRVVDGPLVRVARGLNDEETLRRGVEVRRTYVYGDRDLLVDYADVERHAEEASTKGFDVRRERFEGGEHVALARADPERYWRVVRETWEGVRVDGFLRLAALVATTPARGGKPRERLDCVVRTAMVALVGLELGRARVALLVVLLLVHQRALLAHAERPVVLGLEAAELLRELVPREVVFAVRARSLEDDEPTHGGGAGLKGLATSGRKFVRTG
ncbi:hypothetical protein N657DRAFT_666165 [Parathielavia appendiculata]|uniref:Indole-diterpene biosynthesis protein PaxU n=1 Tax=Parathielavia appendiculata TaxID=2587402 RepID=A0AAN6TTB4_9PEZI|nr:hypothetical protein N657DRAFT_666165 [Parathielavia appendiculata]